VRYVGNMNSVVAPDRPPTLQSARKAFARAHISQAARELFFSQGYAATTFDQIATAAGTRRTTLYSHFRDKAEILEQIADEYQDGLCALVELLEAPVPNRAQIEAWIATLVAFVRQERSPATLVIGLGIGQDTPEAIQRTSQRFPQELAKRVSAFKKAQDQENPLARAWAKVVLRELSLACLQAARDEEYSEHALIVATDLFESFVRDHA
jgi:AcrR family transcriptional regulator